MNLDQKIKLYKNLKQLEAGLKEKLEQLRLDILQELPESHPYKQARVRTSYNEEALADILIEKGLDWCFKSIPDESLVTQAYINGELTDSDLRDIRETTRYEALVIKDV